MKTTFSLSHTDLDGFGCQYVLSKYYKNLDFFNADYGDVQDVLSTILEVISEKDNLYITDLNLTEELAALIDSTSKAIGYKVQLLDHHITGKEQAEKYDWYHLDTTISATKITYNYLSKKFYKNEDTSKIVDLIDTYDMWRTTNKDFRKSQLLSNIIFDNRMDSIKNPYLMIGLVEQIGTLIQVLPVIEVERLIPSITNKLLQSLTTNKDMLRFIQNENIATSVKLGTFPAEGINSFIFCTKTFKKLDNANVVFFKGISSRTSQYAFDYLLKSSTYKNKVLVKYDTKNETLSCRSNNGKAVLVAKHFGGGGHPDAAGAKLEHPFNYYLE